MALIERRTYDRIAPGARARLTRIRLGTGITVITGRTIGLVRIAAYARRWIARSGNVALILRRADDGIAPRANPRLTRVRLRAPIAIRT